MRCIHTRNCDAQLTEFNSDVYRQGNVFQALVKKCKWNERINSGLIRL